MSEYQAFTVKQDRPVRVNEYGVYWVWFAATKTKMGVASKSWNETFHKDCVYQRIIDETQPKLPTDIKTI